MQEITKSPISKLKEELIKKAVEMAKESNITFLCACLFLLIINAALNCEVIKTSRATFLKENFCFFQKVAENSYYDFYPFIQIL